MKRLARDPDETTLLDLGKSRVGTAMNNAVSPVAERPLSSPDRAGLDPTPFITR